tara:strand:- start:305 stop:1060 length:756 start_codon:yes stop_codon:yes gene_type:complete
VKFFKCFFVLLCALIFLRSAPSSAFINVESLRTNPEEGYQGSVSLSGLLQSGNTEKKLVSFDTLNRYLTGDHEILALGNYKYGESFRTKDTHNGSAHLRYARHLWEYFFAEVFAQVEFNEFRSLIERDLLGVAARMRWFQGEHLSLFNGVGMFGEKEQLKGQDGTTDLRGNLYLSLVSKFSTGLKFSMIGYFQPLMNELSDHRINLDADLENPLAKNLNLILSYDYHFDSRPVPGVTKYDSLLKVGLRLNF